MLTELDGWVEATLPTSFGWVEGRVGTVDEDDQRRQQTSAPEQRGGGLARGARRGGAALTTLAVVAVATVVGVTLTGCGAGETGGGSGGGSGSAERVCPAVDYGRTLIVQLGDDWPLVEGHTVVATCSSPCGQVQRDNDELTREVTGAVTGSTARLQMMAMPDSVVVTVVSPEGPVADVEASLAWQRVGGTEECGGPMEAVVTVPSR